MMQHQGECMLCNCHCGIAASIADGNSMLSSSFQINIVVSGCHYADIFQVWAGIQHGCGDGGFVAEQQFCIANASSDFFRSSQRISCHICQFLQGGRGKVIRHGKRVPVRNHQLFHFAAASCCWSDFFSCGWRNR